MIDSDTEALREETLANGVVLRFFDQTNRYFGDYHRVKIVVAGEIPLDESYFPMGDGAGFSLDRAVKLLGDSISFERSIEAMGVPSAEVESKRNDLIESFVGSTMTYMARPNFPIQSILTELKNHKPVRTLSFD